MNEAFQLCKETTSTFYILPSSRELPGGSSNPCDIIAAWHKARFVTSMRANPIELVLAIPRPRHAPLMRETCRASTRSLLLHVRLRGAFILDCLALFILCRRSRWHLAWPFLKDEIMAADEG